MRSTRTVHYVTIHLPWVKPAVLARPSPEDLAEWWEELKFGCPLSDAGRIDFRIYFGNRDLWVKTVIR